jgi:hypothetical protein
MHVLVNGVRLFFDVEGAKLVPDGPVQAKGTALPDQGARATPSTCVLISAESNVRRSCLAARMIRYTRSRVRQISPQRFRGIL